MSSIRIDLRGIPLEIEIDYYADDDSFDVNTISTYDKDGLVDEIDHLLSETGFDEVADLVREAIDKERDYIEPREPSDLIPIHCGSEGIYR